MARSKFIAPVVRFVTAALPRTVESSIRASRAERCADLASYSSVAFPDKAIGRAPRP